MLRVVLESPFAGNCNLNVAYARMALRDSLMRGESPIASHLLYTQKGVLDDNIEHERCKGINAGLDWLGVCHYQVFYVDLGWSNGMIAAKDRAVNSGIKIEERLIFDCTGSLKEFINNHPNDNGLIEMLENKY